MEINKMEKNLNEFVDKLIKQYHEDYKDEAKMASGDELVIAESALRTLETLDVKKFKDWLETKAFEYIEDSINEDLQ